jgi:CubicO group peptidase (beta-lactamase class C family)
LPVRDHDLAELLREHASRHRVPGASLGVLRDGEVAVVHHGVADVATGEPVTGDTRFALGSLGKPMTATVVARAAEAGRLSLDDPVAARVPELRGAAWAERATLRDLLANRSRIPLSVASEFSGWSDRDADVLARVAAKAAVGEPTPAFWSYSNIGWCLLGRAMEVLTGLVWEEVVRDNLLTPLGLTATTFTTWPAARPRATGHEVSADGATGHEVSADGVAPVAAWAPRNLGPAGSTLQSTAGDLLRFAGFHLDEAWAAALRDTSEEIRIHAWLDAWCLGWGRFDWSGGPVWGWDGLISGQRSVLRLVPERRGAVVLLTNCGTGRALYRSMFPELMRECFGIGMPPLRLEPPAGPTDAAGPAGAAGDSAPAAPAGDLARFAGVYGWVDRRWEVTATDAALVLTGARGTIEARPVDDRAFLVDADDPDTPTMTFGAFDDDGRPGVLYQMLWGLPRIGASG